MGTTLETAEARGGLSASEKARCTLTLRLIWGTLLAGQLVFTAVWLGGLGSAGSGAAGPPALAWIPFALLGAGVPAAYFVRNQLYKQNWRGHAVMPQGYIPGNLVVFALLEAVVVAGLVLGTLGPSPGPPRAAAAAAFVLMLLNFPTGRPLEPALPELGVRSERSVDGGR